MKQDLRDLLNPTGPSNKKLPPFHRKEFIEKLESRSSKGPNNIRILHIGKFAAAIFIFLFLGYSMTIYFSEKLTIKNNVTEIESQFKNIEKTYLQNIEREWGNFIALTEDKKLITRYEQKLKKLDTNYQAITGKFNRDLNNITLIEELIENLQNRVQLLKDIQRHILILNKELSKNEKNSI